jgi:hypothetical protein
MMVEGGAMKRIIIMLGFVILILISTVAYGQEWWQTWEVYPKVPRITAKEVKRLMLSGEKMVFVYSGYEIDKIVCNSLFIPYTLVPPNSDGSGVKLRVPADYWVMCY